MRCRSCASWAQRATVSRPVSVYTIRPGTSRRRVHTRKDETVETMLLCSSWHETKTFDFSDKLLAAVSSCSLCPPPSTRKRCRQTTSGFRFVEHGRTCAGQRFEYNPDGSMVFEISRLPTVVIYNDCIYTFFVIANSLSTVRCRSVSR